MMPIYKDKDRNTYYLIVWIEQNDGTKKQVKRRGFKRRKDAIDAELKLLTEKVTDNLTFRSAAQQYLEWYGKRRKHSSLITRENVIKNHLIPEFKDKKLSKITPKNVMDYQSKIIDKFSGSYLSTIHVTLSAIFSFSIKYLNATSNPASLAGNFEVENVKRINYWTVEEFKTFIEYVDELAYYVFFNVMYYTGARKGELLALTWADIDFEKNEINIDKTEYQRQITSPKKKASTRKLLMPFFVMDMLSKLKKDASLEAPVKSGYVVFGQFYDSFSTSTLDRRYASYIKSSGVKRILLHEFRHSHASYLIAKSVDPLVIAYRLGHSDVATTLNTYSHMYPSKQKEAVQFMEDDFK